MRALVIEEEEMTILSAMENGSAFTKMRHVNWPTNGETIDALAVSRKRLTIAVAEEIVGIQLVISQEEERITVKLVTARLQCDLNVAPAVASL